MCLLVVLHRVVPGAALVVGANRDEQLARPARALAVLRPSRPRVLGGLDEQAGGSWLTVNDAGVFVGLTNQPDGRPPDPERPSRGALPVAGGTARSASAALATVVRSAARRHPNPCEVLLGDRTSLYWAAVRPRRPLRAAALGPGLVVLGNAPLGRSSAKTDRVRRSAAALVGQPLEIVLAGLGRLLADHESPAGHGRGQAPGSRGACCVHEDGYGTRSSHLVVVPERPDEPPRLWVADGPPCQVPFEAVDAPWAEPATTAAREAQ
ncbi:NRDE family protein [Aciditerrimonas ferrireducens]|uniref:NRDE family protein n=1 Tax=Aciditerrimonas ferrireducens TaxID=667306 RepID=A0ABV6C1N7_9ACTN